jgi:superfamily II DNA/RNA helicase
MPTIIQQQKPPAILDGRDVVASTWPAHNETVAYALPCLAQLS